VEYIEKVGAGLNLAPLPLVLPRRKPGLLASLHLNHLVEEREGGDFDPRPEDGPSRKRTS